MSSSLLPLNMLPVMTSIQPCCGLLTTSIKDSEAFSRSRLILSGLGADPDLVAFVDKRRHLDNQAGFERCRLDLRAGRGALDAWDCLLDEEVHGHGQLDAHWLDLVELDADDGIGDEVVLGIAEGLARNVDLLVRG